MFKRNEMTPWIRVVHLIQEVVKAFILSQRIRLTRHFGCFLLGKTNSVK